MLALGSLASAPSAMAQSAEPDHAKHSVTAIAETQELSQDRGSMRSARIEYKFDDGDTTVLVAPTIGVRSAPQRKDTSLGIDATIYQEWSDVVSSRTHVFVSENKPVFAHLDLAQDLTARIASHTTLTAGFRWAEYHGGNEVTFVSLGIRQYFKGGSVAYRVTRVNPDRQDAFYAHLINLTINDAHGRGKTQLWASTGAASLARAQFDENFAANDHAVMVQRTQPLSKDLALIALAGVSSYATPTGRYTGVNLGIGLTADLN